MTKAEEFLQQNKAFLQSNFRRDEELLYVEELKRESFLIFIPFVGMWLFVWLVTPIAPLWLRPFLVAGAVYLFVVLLLMISSGQLRREFVVLTTKAIYYCRGVKGITAYDWPSESVRFVFRTNWAVYIVADAPYGSAGSLLVGSRNAQTIKAFWKNIVYRFANKPLQNTIGDLSMLGALAIVNDSKYAMAEFRVKKGSALYRELQQPNVFGPNVKFKTIKYFDRRRSTRCI